MKKIEVKTKRGRKIIYQKHHTVRPTLGASNWPQVSDAYSVGPKYAEEYAKAAAQAGVPTEFVELEGGMYGPKFEDRNHRKRYYQWQGDFDKNGGYSDAQPN